MALGFHTQLCQNKPKSLGGARFLFMSIQFAVGKGNGGEKIPLAGKVLDLSSLIMMICFLLLDVCTRGQTHMII